MYCFLNCPYGERIVTNDDVLCSKDEIMRKAGVAECPFFTTQNSPWFDDIAEHYKNQINDEPKNDPVNHPSHYTQGGIECIDALQAACEDKFEGYLQGNIIKYVWRYRHKNGVEDLKKARWYLDRLIGYFGG